MKSFFLPAITTIFLLGQPAVRADFYISSLRVPNAVTVGDKSFDTITFFVTDTGTNHTGSTLNLIDVGMYDSTGGGKNGMLISAGGMAPGYPDVYDSYGESSLPHTSWVNGSIPFANLTPGFSVATMVGTQFTFDLEGPNNGGLGLKESYSDGQEVAGIGAVIFWLQSYPNASAGLAFAQATVEHGDQVTLVTPVDLGRTVPSSQWETGGTGFGIPKAHQVFSNATGTYQDTDFSEVPVPEPAGAGLFALSAMRSLCRRRRR
jgi:hypothetical protein